MEAIILAAGYSSRANAYKMTLPIGEMTVLEHTISKFEGVCSRVIIITGYKPEIIEAEMKKVIAKAHYAFRIDLVFNKDFQQGMFHSIKAGCREIKSANFFLTPGDCSLVNNETVWDLAKQQGEVVIPSFNLKGGHPIKLSSKVKKQVLESNSENNLREVLNQYKRNYFAVNDPGVIMDIDTPEDYQKALKYYQQSMHKKI